MQRLVVTFISTHKTDVDMQICPYVNIQYVK